MKQLLHQDNFQERWSQLSLIEQLANIGSEVGRASKWQGKDEQNFWGAVERALELFDLTLSDKRWKNRLKEIARLHELFCGAVLEGTYYETSLKDLDHYFLHFAYAARLEK